MIRRMLPALAGLAFLLGLPTGAPASDDPSLNLAGKTVRFLLSSGVGSGGDLQARMIARYLEKHLPGNPRIVAQNVPGAAGVKLIHYLKSLDPEQDLIIATIGSNLPFGVRSGRISRDVFDPRDIAWVGTLVDSTNICLVGKAADTGDVDSLREKPLSFGTRTRTGPPHAMYLMLNRGAGFNIKPVIGYDSPAALHLAVTRGEIDGECTSKSSYSVVKPLIDEGKVRIFLYLGPRRRDDMNAPYLLDLGMSDDQRVFIRLALTSISFGRPLAVPAGTDPRFLEAVRKALAAVAVDPDYLKEAESLGIDVTYTSPEELAAAVADLYATPDALIAEIAELVGSE